MRATWIIAAIAAAACGGPQQPGGGGGAEPVTAPADTRTELERRRDRGCEAVGPKLVQCAVEDARADFEAGKVSKKEYELNVSGDARRGLEADWLKKCRVEMSSRQVRVLEVCLREEQACEPLLACLENLNPT